GPSAPGLVAAGLSLVNFVSAYVVLPESLKAEHRTERELWDFSHIGDAIQHPRLAPLMLAWLLAPFAFSGYTVALPLWAGVTFGWREQELGWFFTVIGTTAAVVQGYAFGKLARRFGDRALLITGGFGMALAIAVIPTLHSGAALYGWTAVLAFANSIFAPAATGLFSVAPAGASCALRVDSTWVIRNAAVVGDGASGKTSPVHALACVAGTSKRHGSVKHGTALTDYTPDEIERKYSINLALAVAEW